MSFRTDNTSRTRTARSESIRVVQTGTRRGEGGRGADSQYETHRRITGVPCGTCRKVWVALRWPEQL